MHIEAINLTSHPLPVPATPRSAGLDLKAAEYALIPPGGRAELVQVESLDDTERGEGGFGHTGR